MSDVVVNELEWVKLNEYLNAIREDAEKINSFMAKHVNTKYKV
jgi:hypothetical protein